MLLVVGKLVYCRTNFKHSPFLFHRRRRQRPTCEIIPLSLSRYGKFILWFFFRAQIFSCRYRWEHRAREKNWRDENFHFLSSTYYVMVADDAVAVHP